MSLHKLTAGSGYDYLTRQVAAMDATDKGHTGLASYYIEKGEMPGVWLGSGMEGVEGLDAGDIVTADHMQSLFGSGHHPLATQRTKELDLRIGRDEAGRPTEADYKTAVRLGTPYKVYDNDISPFRIEVAKRIAALNEAAGLPGDWPVPAADRAKIRTEVAAEFFRAEHGREPADARELAATIAKHSRPKTNAVAGYDLTFSPVKSVSVLWAISDPKTAAVIERAHQAASKDALDFIESKALFTRQGTNGVRQVDVRGLIATAFTHRDSRAGDPDLHTHHAANVALHDNGRDRVTDARESGRRVQLAQHHSPYAVAPTGVWVDRMSACENTARSYLTDRFPHALAGEAIRPVDDPGRLAQALANWDIQSHRALARHLAPANVLLITRTEGLIAGASMVLVNSAATAGVLEFSERLVPAIADAGRSWSNLASRWGDLVPPAAHLDEPLARAAAEVRAAYRHITHDTATLATPEAIAVCPELPQATMASLRAIEAGSELAHVIAEKADTPNLTGPARALSRRAHNDVESGLASPPTEGDVVWVSPADILARRVVTVPQPVADALRSVSTATASAASVAATTAMLARSNDNSHLPPRPNEADTAHQGGHGVTTSSPNHGKPFGEPPGGIDRPAPVGPLR
ncbi:MobF family relaxase [Nocardioides abyssi]|uniref:MobF family relaxase n=2 Tax=Nocardioides TaxID=1839 RepID=A0ABT8EUM9_9ACTN|nr:MobF family relaxase [Nocardioides abyssi]MDN4161880.1 MobF family relaxase [Nocardioides abyssi]